jgi:transcriptional regulator with XRE-family HTH domain
MDLQAYMNARGLTDAQFGEKVGRDRSVVSRWRRKETLPDIDSMKRIAEATEGLVTPNDFLGVETPAGETSDRLYGEHGDAGRYGD